MQFRIYGFRRFSYLHRTRYPGKKVVVAQFALIDFPRLLVMTN